MLDHCCKQRSRLMMVEAHLRGTKICLTALNIQAQSCEDIDEVSYATVKHGGQSPMLVTPFCSCSLEPGPTKGKQRTKNVDRGSAENQQKQRKVPRAAPNQVSTSTQTKESSFRPLRLKNCVHKEL